MEFRSAFPVAVAFGVLLGFTAVGNGAPRPIEVTPRPVEPIDPEISARPLPIPPVRVVEMPVTFDLPVVWNESVERFVSLFRDEQTDRIALYLKRAGRYEGMIRSKLRERGLPEDLVYLSMIESGFNPNARSRASAVGLWQFMAGTAREYGLRVDGYVDERRDPEKSTDAALEYLEDLHRRFGAWSLVAAAYNSGHNRVARIMREETGSERGREEDFWRIRRHLPRDTREYVPLIYAAAVIGKQPEKYGLLSVERWVPVSTDTVLVPGGTDLGVVAKAVGVTEEDLRRLNPALVKSMTPPGRNGYAVRIPDNRAGLYEQNFAQAQAEAAKLAKAEKAKSGGVHRHKVRRGESLWSIAKDHGVSIQSIQRANRLGRRTTLRAGEVLRIPA